MALDIGLSPINKTVVAKLLGANVLAFVVVLSVLCLSVYAFALTTSQTHVKEKLIVFAGSVVGSIDSGETEPDLIRSPEGTGMPVSLVDKKLQWFSPVGELVHERGSLQVHHKFDRLAQFQTQEKPHVLLFTRPAIINNKLLGYVRIAQSLDAVDSELETLCWGLLIGAATALIASSAGIVWLTSLALKPIEESFLRLKQFTDDASHELRNPIMAIKSNCSLTVRHADSLAMEHKTRLLSAMDAADQLMQMADDLLLLARTDRNSAVESPDLLDLGVLVTEILEASKSQAEERQLTLHAIIAPALRVRGDEQQLRRALSNLVQNAILYTEPGGEIRVVTQCSGEQVVCKVIDTGIGIAPQDLSKVFDRFWRADRARSLRAGGTGLGLAIAKSIVEQHNGKMTVSSVIDKGSTFTVTFPTAAGKT